jgi:uncharacterized protein with PQ loop repeat
MPHVVLVCAAVGAIGIGVVSTVVQFLRIIRNGVEGVSLATWSLFVFTSVFWVSYGIVSSHSLAVVLGSALVAPFQIYIVARLSPLREWRTVAKSALFAFVLMFAPIALWGWPAALYGAGLGMTLMRLPQFVELIKVRHAQGVSALSWYSSAACSGCWVVYYVGAHLWAALSATAAAGVASLAIGGLATLRHVQTRRERHTHVRSA